MGEVGEVGRGRRASLPNSGHNEEVASLRQAYGRAENRGAPIVFAADEPLWLKLAGESFRQFYAAPRTQLEVSLRGAAWFAANVVHDQPEAPRAVTYQRL